MTNPIGPQLISSEPAAAPVAASQDLARQEPAGQATAQHVAARGEAARGEEARGEAEEARGEAERGDAAQHVVAPARTRGVIALVPELCTSCLICARECPDWCIHIDSHTETAPPETPRGRPRTHNVLDRFAIDFGSCLYCGICIEVCPFDALLWAAGGDYSASAAAGLVQEQDRLASWAARHTTA